MISLQLFKMTLEAMIFLSLLVTAVLAQTLELSIDDFNIQNNWPTMEKYLSKQRVLRLYEEDLTEASIVKVMSLQLPLLEELYFSIEIPQNHPADRYVNRGPQVLTHLQVESIFRSKFFPRLKVLDLKDTNIDDRYLAFLQGLNLTTALSELSLEECQVGRAGFQHLSRVRFTNLTKLNISNTMLAEGQAVDALIAIICGHSAERCENNLLDLDISKTGITREHFIRLIRRINPDPLRSLTLRHLSLTYRQTYNEGYNYSAFEVLAGRFSNLQILDLEDSLVNDEVAALFQNWTLHSLTLLNVGENHLSDAGVKLWINTRNMPNLEVLNLYSNEVGDETVTHLIDQQYEFTKFFFGNCRLTAVGAKSLSLLPSDRLERLLLQVQIPSQTLNDFFEQGTFANLRELTIMDNDLLTNIFSKISWGKLPKLQRLAFKNCNLKDSFEEAIGNFEGKPLKLFPNLEFLILSETQLTQQIVGAALLTAPYFFPKLLEFYVMQEDTLDAAHFIGEALAKSNFREGMYINVNELELVKRGNQFDLLSLPNLQFLFFSQSKEELAFEVIVSKIPTAIRTYDFASLTDVALGNKLVVDYFFRILEEAKITTLHSLTSLEFEYTVDVDFLLDEIGEVQMPALRRLGLSLVIPADVEENYIERVQLLLGKFKHLTHLMLDVTFLSEDKGFLMKKQLLDSLHFPHLTNLVMNDQNMEAQEIANFIRNHSHTLRSINMGNNFMETQFLRILVEEGIVLQKLSLDSTSFVVGEFAVLGEVNTQFLSFLSLTMNDLTNEHVLAMLAHNKTGPFFPKLIYLGLSNNDVRQEGLNALLATGMHSLLTLDLEKNSNPQFINIMLTYPTRIAYLIAAGVETYGLQGDLNPRSTLNLEAIILKTKSFLREDFSNLAKLSFSTLKQGLFDIYNAYDCEVLADLLKINRWTKMPELHFKNDENGLNSSCLSSAFESQALGINLIDYYGTTYLHEFAERMLNTSQEINYVSLVNTRFPPQFFSNLFKHSFSQLQVMILKTNYVGDTATRDFFKKAFPNLLYLHLENADISDATVEAISRSKMPELKVLVLDRNLLGVKAIKALQKVQSDIILLSLMRCGLKGEALEAIGQFQSQSLVAILLSYNDFTGAELLNFVSNLERKSLPRLMYLGLQGIELTKEEHSAIMAVLTPKSIEVVIDAPHNMAKVNAAHY